MYKEYNADPTDERKKEEDYITPNEKLLNDNDEYQEGGEPNQMLSKENMSHQGTVYSSFRIVDEDVNGRTSKGVRKKVKRRVVVCVGLLAIILMLTTLGFTLVYASLPRGENVTSVPESIITEVPPIPEYSSAVEFRETAHNYRIAAKKGNADAQFHLGSMYEHGQGVNQSYEKAVKWYRKAAEQENQQNRDTPMRKCTSDGCIQRGEGLINLMMKHSNGTENRQNKVMKLDNIILESCTEMDEACPSQMKKLSNGFEKLLNKGTQMRNCILDGCISMGEV
uniref:Uncharacterized protein n=1 Tax=Plectus sambesii TaxID=2011161 RepID=A0A914X9M4_9BILA